MSHDDARDESLDLSVYLALLALTALTVGASFLEAGRAVAITGAFAIAAAKASLIGGYYMGLRREPPLLHAVVWIGLAAVFILLLGILPDLLRW